MKQPSALIVDDDARLRELLVLTMSMLGYQTRAATDGAGALVAFDREWFSVVITDLNMPRIDGRELVRRLRERRPDVAIVLVSGVMPADDGTWPTDRFVALQKPVSLGDLRAAISLVTGTASDRFEARPPAA